MLISAEMEGSISSRSKLLLAFLKDAILTPVTASPFRTTSNRLLALGSLGIFLFPAGFLYGAYAHPMLPTPITVRVKRVFPMLANSWAVHGILVFVTHLKTVEETFLSVPVNPLAVLGCFQSWIKVVINRQGEWCVPWWKLNKFKHRFSLIRVFF